MPADALIVQHAFKDGWCLHCGAKYHPSMTATCLQRAAAQSGLMPEPARREYACEAFDAIGERLAELQKPVEPEKAPGFIADLF